MMTRCRQDVDVRDIRGRVQLTIVVILGGVGGVWLAMQILNGIRLRRGDSSLTLLIGFVVGGVVAGIAHEWIRRYVSRPPRIVIRLPRAVARYRIGDGPHF
jgi:hypothetical protein